MLIGGLDSLWFKSNINNARTYFHILNSNEIVIGLIQSEDAPLIEDVLDDFISFINNSILVAHNIEFDLSFINRVIDENQKNINFDNICDTLLLSRSFLFNLEKFNLEYLSLFFDLDIKNSHRAKFDALNTGNILIKLIQQMISIP